MTDPEEFRPLCYWCGRKFAVAPGKLPFCNGEHEKLYFNAFAPDGQELERMRKKAQRLLDKAQGKPVKTMPFASRSGAKVF